MLAPITVRYSFRPARRSIATGHVADLFGLPEREPPHTVADGIALDIRPGDLVLFTGPSGSGESSLLREAAKQLGAVDAFALDLPNLPLIDALPGSVEDRLATLSGCGLSEARLLLRTSAELSEGQRYRFRLAFARAQYTREAEAPPLAIRARRRVHRFAGSAARQSRRLQPAEVGQPHWRRRARRHHARGHLRRPEPRPVGALPRRRAHRSGATRRKKQKNDVSFANELWLSAGTRADWPHFARWHYRSHHLAYTRKVILLWHGRESIGICVFGTPAASLSLRTRFFGLTNPRSGVAMAGLNQQLWLLQRVVIHPTYRGAGIAANFVRKACELCPVDWVETLSAMGQVNPFFERAGFTRVGVIRKNEGNRTAHGAYGSKRTRVTGETLSKSRFSEPVYYVFDNRRRT